MKHLSICIGLFVVSFSSFCFGHEYLVSLKDPSQFALEPGERLELVSKAGQLYLWRTQRSLTDRSFQWDTNVDFIQPNSSLDLIENPDLTEVRKIKGVTPEMFEPSARWILADNPDLLEPAQSGVGPDPKVKQAWGLKKIGAILGHDKYPQGQGVVVAVIDTGVDYNHEDLSQNIWRNEKEIPGDAIDNDENGFVDDVIGWDFASDDNKPFDYSRAGWDLFVMGGNAGHGTHVSGVIAAVGSNAVGIAGVAPRAKIMPIRFLNEKGHGTTANGVRAIDYAVANGAKVINASWGGPRQAANNPALEEAIKRAEEAGVIFVAAAGNGRGGSGFDNDNDDHPMEPASFNFPLMVSVAALDVKDRLAKFSNWGKQSVKIGAPGVKIFSTIPGNRYSQTVLNFYVYWVNWNGTSMAAPHVAGSLALLWSEDLAQSGAEVRRRLLDDVELVSGLEPKIASGGRLQIR